MDRKLCTNRTNQSLRRSGSFKLSLLTTLTEVSGTAYCWVECAHRGKVFRDLCMSTKEEKPTLAGVQIKARKRNVAVALDPGSFSDAVVTVFEDAAKGDTVEDLNAAVKVLENVDLDFSRYGDSFFEILFTGGRMAAGGNVVEEGKKLKINVRPQPLSALILKFVLFRKDECLHVCLNALRQRWLV